MAVMACDWGLIGGATTRAVLGAGGGSFMENLGACTQILSNRFIFSNRIRKITDKL